MNPRIKLSAIIDCISYLTPNTSCYLDRNSCELLLLSKEYLRAAEEDDRQTNYPEWQQVQIKLARKILADKNKEKYIPIPAGFVSHEYSAMENFCFSIQDKEISKSLCRAIIGRGAFRRFKDRIHLYGISDNWHKYRYDVMKKIVIHWCKANNINCIEE